MANNWGPHYLKANFLWITTIPLAGIGAWALKKWKQKLFDYKQLVRGLILGIMLMMMVVYFYSGLKSPHRNYLTHPESLTLAEMEKWVRENTPHDSIFVVLPDMWYMRIRARRAIVVDWQSTPYFPSDLQEWYKRICDISGLSSDNLVTNPKYIIEGYKCLDAARAKMLQERYNADYVVVSTKEHTGDLSGLKEIFVNEDYRVLKIPFLKID